MRTIRILDAAADEAAEAAAWYERQHSGLGTEFEHAVDAALDLLEKEIVVIAFAHHSRRPGYWRGRLRR